MKKTIIAIYLMVRMASAETTQFRFGHLAVMLFDVLGFNVTDLTTAIPDYFWLLFVFAIVGGILYVVKWRKK